MGAALPSDAHTMPAGEAGAGGADPTTNPAAAAAADETVKTEAPQDPQKELSQAEKNALKKTKVLRSLFDQFDQTPKDGKLDRAEFKLCMAKIANGKELRDDVVVAAFDKVDLDHNGGVDFEEFQKGYDLIERYATDKPAQTATKALDIAKAVSVTASVAIGVAESINKNVHVNVKTSKTEETTPLKSTVAVEEEATSRGTVTTLQLALTSQVSMAWSLVVCSMCQVIIPMIAFWIAVGSGESCDVPLDTFCWGQAFICTIAVPATLIQIRRALSASKKEGDEEQAWQLLGAQSQTDLDATQGGYCCVFMFLLIWNVIGLYWFIQTGFLAGGEGNCVKLAPTVYTIVWWYWLLVVIAVCCAIPCGITMICCLVIFGPPTKISMTGDRS